jgi:long-chain acyl-CoA synthetase
MTSSIDSAYAAKPWLKNYDLWAPAEINPPNQPLYQILQVASGAYREKPAVAFMGAFIDFGEAKKLVDLLATALQKLGVVKGDRVGIMLPNCPQYLLSFFAVVRLGAIVVNVNPIYTPREVEMVAKDSGMRAIIALDLLTPNIFGVRANTAIEHVIVTSLLDYSATPDKAPPSTEGTLSFKSLIGGVGEVDLPRVEIDPAENVRVLQYIGGMIGEP